MSDESQRVTDQLVSPLKGFPFLGDWLQGEEFPLRFLSESSLAIGKRIEHLAGENWRPWSPDEIADVRNFNLQGGNVAGADLAGLLADHNMRVVVTGQQPDLLASPLYVLHKALSAVAWAKKLSAETGEKVIPVFWVASDDDDFNELKHASLVGFDGTVTDVGMRISRAGGVVAYHWNLAESAERLKGDLAHLLSGWKNGSDVADGLAALMEGHPNFETLFCRLLAELLGPQNPVLFVAPRLKAFRGRQADLLQSDLRIHTELNARLTELNTKFEEAGYAVGVNRDAEALNFFWLKDGVRHRLVEKEGRIAALENKRNSPAWEMSGEELHQRIGAAPEEFAPNVVTRPVLQDEVLPSLAYIGGPGEVAYLAILGEAYRAYGRSRAAVVPRTLVTMLPQDSTKLDMLHRYADRQDLSESILSGGSDDATVLASLLTELTSLVADKLSEMRRVPAASRQEIARAIEKTETHILHGIDQLKKRLAKQVTGDEWSRVNRLVGLVLPEGGSQERKLSPWNFVHPGDWATLAVHLQSQVDYTFQGPQCALLPPWIEEQL